MERRERPEERSLRRHPGGGARLGQLGPLVEELELGQRAAEEHRGLAVRAGGQRLWRLGEDAGVERAGQPRQFLDLPGGDRGQRVLRRGADQPERGVERRLGMTVAAGEHVLEHQRVGLAGVAPERLVRERAGALGLVLDQERMEAGEGHRARRSASVSLARPAASSSTAVGAGGAWAQAQSASTRTGRRRRIGVAVL